MAPFVAPALAFAAGKAAGVRLYVYPSQIEIKPPPSRYSPEQAAAIERAITDRLLRNVGEGLASACFWAVTVIKIVEAARTNPDVLSPFEGSLLKLLSLYLECVE
ncbi:MAG TPA: hypothetical protein VFU97_24555 [Xanthobacteraceae bacterium]|nr:hypothetical protein [Xanthobacteraceae bacterium]